MTSKIIGEGFCVGNFTRKKACSGCRWKYECSYSTACGLDPMMLTSSLGKAVRNIYNHMIDGCDNFSEVARFFIQLWGSTEEMHVGGKLGKLVFYEEDKEIASLSCKEGVAKLNINFAGVKLSRQLTPEGVASCVEELKGRLTP